MLGTALARGLGWSGARVWGSSGLAVQRAGEGFVREKTSCGYSVPLKPKGPGWVLEVGKAVAKYPEHGSQRGSAESRQVLLFKSQGHG